MSRNLICNRKKLDDDVLALIFFFKFFLTTWPFPLVEWFQCVGEGKFIELVLQLPVLSLLLTEFSPDLFMTNLCFPKASCDLSSSDCAPNQMDALESINQSGWLRYLIYKTRSGLPTSWSLQLKIPWQQPTFYTSSIKVYQSDYSQPSVFIATLKRDYRDRITEWYAWQKKSTCA